MSSPRPLSIGKRRRLSRISHRSGTFTLVAADQRGNLRRALRPDDPDAVPASDLIAFKSEIAATLAAHGDGLLLDPEYGAAQAIATGSLPGSAGLVVAIEETGYEADAHDRATALLPGFGPAEAAALGADAAKLLLYFHPDAGRADAQLTIVQECAAACAAVELPLIVEPLSFSIEPGGVLAADERRRVVVETARRLSALDIDVLKLEFPLPPDVEDHARWADACAEVDDAAGVPWLILSAGVSFELFAEQSAVACAAGASGVLAGRAVWKESTGLGVAERRAFLETTATDRVRCLTEIVRAGARPWTDSFLCEAPADPRWFEALTSGSDAA